LETSTRNRIAAKLETVAETPEHYLSRLAVVEAYKLRVGDYRLIIDLDPAKKKLFVVTLGHRSTVYR
jgi:mRNA interferase RelE/StbE